MLPAAVISKAKTMVQNHEEHLDPYRMQARISREMTSVGVTLNNSQLAELLDYCRTVTFAEERKGNACKRNIRGGEV
jgi:hypothetical protein